MRGAYHSAPIPRLLSGRTSPTIAGWGVPLKQPPTPTLPAREGEWAAKSASREEIRVATNITIYTNIG